MMKTKWKLIYETHDNKNGYSIEYKCYYEDCFAVMYRTLYVIENKFTAFELPKRKFVEYTEVTKNKFDAVEKSIEYWKTNKDKYIASAIESINAK